MNGASVAEADVCVCVCVCDVEFATRLMYVYVYVHVYMCVTTPLLPEGECTALLVAVQQELPATQSKVMMAPYLTAAAAVPVVLVVTALSSSQHSGLLSDSGTQHR